MERLLSWRNPWAYQDTIGHQVIQSWTAMARGGLWGVGLGESLQKLGNRLPEAETDFIFAVIVEELGLAGGIFVILLFLLFTWRGFSIALRARDRYSMLLAGGVTTWVAGQAVLNLGVVTGTLPNTGIPLPFLSSGGSSLLALMIGAGLLLSVSRLPAAEPRAQTAARTPERKRLDTGSIRPAPGSECRGASRAPACAGAFFCLRIRSGSSSAIMMAVRRITPLQIEREERGWAGKPSS